MEKIIKEKTDEVYCKKKEQQEKEQKEKENRRLERRITIGRIIIYTMAILNIPFSFVLVAIGYPVFYFLVQIGLSIVLILGFNWARILFGIGALVHGFMAFLIAIQYVPHGESISSVVVTMICFVGGIFLLFSRSVKEYVYFKRGG